MTAPTLADQILAVLGTDEIEGHEVAERVRGWQVFAVTPFGSIYATLDRMVRDGALAVRWDDDGEYPRRRIYRTVPTRPEIAGG
jgi:DNA-binding PadR family transcriptional regulator